MSPSWAASLIPANLLRPAEEAERTVREHASERYMDPELASNPEEYGEFLASLHVAGMLGWGVIPSDEITFSLLPRMRKGPASECSLIAGFLTSAL